LGELDLVSVGVGVVQELGPGFLADISVKRRNIQKIITFVIFFF
jgi:hypothetical protein